jgi:hypothetical protein
MDILGIGMSDEQQPVIIGNDEFIKRMAATSGGDLEANRPETVSIQADDEGNIVGDTSGIPDHILAQLQTPEARAQIAKQQKDYRYAYRAAQKEPPRPMRYLNEREDRRLFADRCPPGMTSKEWRKKCRSQFRKMTKNTKKIQKQIAEAKKEKSNG